MAETTTTMVGGGDYAMAADVFRRYDHDSSGQLDSQELRAALRDTGLLSKVSAAAAGRLLADMDSNGDGVVSFAEFREAYSRLARLRGEEQRQGRITRAPPAVPPNAATDPRLKAAFLVAASWGAAKGLADKADGRSDGLTSRQFQRACTAANLPIEQAAADVVFTCCRKGSQRLSFPRFLDALAQVALESASTLEAVLDAVRATAPAAASSPAKDVDSRLPLSARASRRPRSAAAGRPQSAGGAAGPACQPFELACTEPIVAGSSGRPQQGVQQQPWQAPYPSQPQPDATSKAALAAPALAPAPQPAPFNKLQERFTTLQQLLEEGLSYDDSIPAHSARPSNGVPAGHALLAGQQQQGSDSHMLLGAVDLSTVAVNPTFQGQQEAGELSTFKLDLLTLLDQRCEAAEARCAALVATRAEMTRALVAQMGSAAGTSPTPAQQDVLAAMHKYEKQMAAMDSKLTTAVQQVAADTQAAVAALESKLVAAQRSNEEAMKRVNEAVLLVAKRVGSLFAAP